MLSKVGVRGYNCVGVVEPMLLLFLGSPAIEVVAP